MSNVATYLNSQDKEKLERISTKCQTSNSKVLQLILKHSHEDYLVELVNGYKD